MKTIKTKRQKVEENNTKVEGKEGVKLKSGWFISQVKALQLPANPGEDEMHDFELIKSLL